MDRTTVHQVLKDTVDQIDRQTAALRWAISWVEATKGEKVTESGYKEFLAGIKRIEEGRA